MPEHNCEVFDMYQEGRYFSVRCRVCYKPALWYDLHSVGGGLAFQFLNISDRYRHGQSSIRVDGTDDQTQLLWTAALCYIWS